MKRQILVNGLLSLTAVTFMTACVDDKYDLSDIDTTTQIKVDSLTVPVKLKPIKLENVIDFDDNDSTALVKTENGEYVITRGGIINPTEFKIDPVNVTVPNIDGTNFSVNLPSNLPILPNIQISNLSLGEFPIDMSSVKLVDYGFNMDNIHEALVSLKDVKTTPINVRVVLKMNPAVLVGGDNEIMLKNLELQLPKNLMDVTGVASYDAESGKASVDPIRMDNRTGIAELSISADGLVVNKEIVNHKLSIDGKVGVLGGSLDITLKNFTLTEVPSSLNIDVDFSVDNFTIESFSGKVNYNMDAIHIDPISLNDLPDFLDNPETNLIIANPQILVGITNPVGRWLTGKGQISLVSNFKDGDRIVKVENSSDPFTLVGDHSDLAFCTPADNATLVKFDGLRNVLSDGKKGLPTSIEVNIHDINFAGDVTDFPLGPIGVARGDYKFRAPLGFGKGTTVIYETTEGDWGSEDLDNVNINHIRLSATCTTNLPVGVHLTVTPIDKYGKEIDVKENSGLFVVPAMSQNHPVALTIECLDKNHPIKGFDGVKFRAEIRQDSPDNTQAIGPDLQIELNDLRVTVDGYFEKEL